MDVQYKGMTVNERLFASGLIDDFDKLVDIKDVEGVIKILEQVEITDELAVRSILEKLGLNE